MTLRSEERIFFSSSSMRDLELRCSRCNEEVEWDIDLARKPRFCSNCGARMVEKQGDMISE